jgi:prepilin-type N-terminal cleavage/methylation domain-containing protein
MKPRAAPGTLAPARGGRRAAFTLIELLVALGIMSVLLAALFTFVFSMAEVWGRGAERRLFEQHANAVARHIESMARRAALPLGGPVGAEAFVWREFTGLPAGTARLLSFDLAEGDRLLHWPEAPLPQVRCALAAENSRGLVLYWRSELEPAGQTQPRATVVSPFVTRLDYAFYDEAGSVWREDVQPVRDAEGRWRVPERIKLTFTYGGTALERVITLPLAPGGRAAF